MDKINLTIIGGSAVGKSCIIIQYIENEYYDNILSTLGFDFKDKEITIDDKTITLIILDTPASEKFSAITKTYLKKSNIVLIVYSMFENCSSLTTLDVSKFDTKNVFYMDSMFSGCSSLNNLDISKFDTKNVKDMKFMFSNC